MRDTFYMRAKQKIKNHAAAIVVTAAMLGCTGAILSTRACPGGSKNEISARAPKHEDPVRNDNFCDQREASPYLMDKAGRYLLDKKGGKIKNPDYSFADCYKGNDRCDPETKLADLRDQEGNPLDLSLLKIGKGQNGEDQICFTDGSCRSLPLEKAGSKDLNDDSFDCAMEQVRKEPCMEEATPKLKRRMLTKIDVDTPLVQRTRSFIERMLKNPSLSREANNYFVMRNDYTESCEDPTADLCDPDIPKKCFCSNACGGRPLCKPNGVLDAGENCDPMIKKGKGSCKAGEYCHGCRECRKKPEKCGNKRKDPGEDCDPPNSACTKNGRKGVCTDICTCHVRDDKPLCENGRLDPGEISDTPGTPCTKDGKGGKVSKNCKACELENKTISECKSHETVSAVKQTIRRKIAGRALEISNLYEPTGDAVLSATVVAYFTSSGSFQSYTMVSSCTAGKGGGTCTKAPTASEKAAAHKLDGMDDLSIAAPGDDCKATAGRIVPSSSR
ncbi:MAG: hypothetical protein V1827_04445 [Candidatus Micrarchaeota archaeon]